MITLYYKIIRFFNPSLMKLFTFVSVLFAISIGFASGYEPTMLATEIVSEFTYDFSEPNRSNVFSGHKILALVPHQDDEACIMGGLFDQYVKNGSTVYVAFSTNGDYDSPDMTKVRAAESLAALNLCGIHSENVYFLGYGDQWRNEHIYHASGNKKLTSHAGKTQTYGSDENHSIYKEGRDYTRNNLKEDLRSLIEEIYPDTIYCIDFDGHKDHRALSLLFEEVLGEMLHEHFDYTPSVFKGFGYSLAWHAAQDFYQDNILSGINPYDTPYMQENNYYNWSDRVRFPVIKDALGRLKSATSTYKMLTCYPTQLASGQAGGIINGDKVFWYRDTSSLLYHADIQVSSGNAAVLNDYKIIDSQDITKTSPVFSNHVWFPTAKDNKKSITVSLHDPTDLTELRFYDNPDVSSNILDMSVIFSDGTQLQTGPLQTNGAATSVRFDTKKDISGFTVFITSSEGKDAGLCEIEAYNDIKDNGVHLIKLINVNDDFVYDYWINEEGYEDFSLYVYPYAETTQLESSYTLEYDDINGCSAMFDGNIIAINCPVGESFELTIRSIDDPAIYDTVKISNPSHARRLLLRLLQHVEHAAGL